MNFATFNNLKNYSKTPKISAQMKVATDQMPEPRHVYFNSLTNSVWFSLRPGSKGKLNTYLGEL